MWEDNINNNNIIIIICYYYLVLWLQMSGVEVVISKRGSPNVCCFRPSLSVTSGGAG